MISSRILCRYFCLALLATKRLKAEVPEKLLFSPRGVPRTETTEAQQQVKTRRESLIPASTSGLLSGVPWTFWSFCQSDKSCDGHKPPTSTNLFLEEYSYINVGKPVSKFTKAGCCTLFGSYPAVRSSDLAKTF